MNYAAIAIFAFRRLDHLRQVIDALFENSEFIDSSVYIFSDEARTEDQKKDVERVRNYLQTIKHPKLRIIKAEANKGLSKSIIGGVSKILETHSSVIVIEDDIVVGKQFLCFMNDALTKYTGHSHIMSVSGYSYPIKIPENYKQSVLLTQRFSAWGWGTWKHAWDKADWAMKDYVEFTGSWSSIRRFKGIGYDLPWMLHLQMIGRIDSWAVRWLYAHYKERAYCVMPVESLLTNVGLDGSGTHGDHLPAGSVFLQNKQGEKPESLPDNPVKDHKIIERICGLYRPKLGFGLVKHWVKLLLIRYGAYEESFLEQAL